MKKLVLAVAGAAMLGAFAVPTVSIDAINRDGGGEVASVDLAIDGVDDEAYLFAAYGLGAGSADSLSGWDTVEQIAVLSSSDTTANFTVPSGWGTTVFNMRFFIASEKPYDSALDYIETSDSATIYLGFTAGPNMVSRMKFRYTYNNGGALYGYVPNGSDDYNDYRLFSYGNAVFFDIPPANSRISCAFSLNTDYEWELGNNYIKDLASGDMLALGAVQTFSRPATLDPAVSEMMLFGIADDRGRVYWLDIYDNDADPDDLQLVHKFRPVLKNGVAGLYD
ncbi:MAG: hypothetical protein ILO34_08425, partial [Kiritimatiellae bacterium]|nr:hypothetical protein [Kiritimatiellia bacterium]